MRAWNSPAPADNPDTPDRNESRTCDGQPVEPGFEGLHIWDISNRRDPELIGEVELSARPEADAFGCGSHTITGVPDRRNDRLLVYNQTSGGPCPFIGIIEVPFDDPASARFLRNEPLVALGPNSAAHDTGVILGDVNLMAVASHDMAHVFDIGRNDRPGGSLEDPEFLYTIQEPGVCNVPDDPNNPMPQRPCNGNCTRRPSRGTAR